jgi:hypothetical protein
MVIAPALSFHVILTFAAARLRRDVLWEQSDARRVATRRFASGNYKE